VIGYRLNDGVWSSVGTGIVSSRPRSGDSPTLLDKIKKKFLTVDKVAISPPSGDKINKCEAFPPHTHTFQWPHT
jgi:hypothetical protein